MTKSYLFIIGLVMSTSCFAVEITTSNGIHIVANTISIDIRTGTSTYEGDVAVTQDSMSFDADKITVHESNKVLTKFIATGTPVVFINQLATPEGISQGEASKFIYTEKDNKVFLEEFSLKDAVGNTTSGQQGTYLLEK